MSPAVLASEALRAIRDMAERPGASVDDIREVADLALTRLSLAGRFRDRTRQRIQWLAKVTSFAFPRTFYVGALPQTDDPATLLEAARRQHHVCFTVQITQGGGKDARHREVEVQVPADKAMQLGQQIVRIAQSFDHKNSPAAARRGSPVSPLERRRMT